VLRNCSRKSAGNAAYGWLRKIEDGDRQEQLFPRIKEFIGFPVRYNFSAGHAQRVFQQNRPPAA